MAKGGRERRKGLRGLLLDHRPDRWIFLALLVLLVWLPLARGSNRLWAVSLFEVYVFLLAAGWLFLYLRGRLPAPASLTGWGRPIVVLALLWLAWIGFQLVPLPAALLGWLSPATLEVRQAAADFLGEPLAWAPLSLVPGETRAHWLESAAYLCLFCLVAATVRGNTRPRVLAMTLVVSGLFQALYGTLFLLSGASQGLFWDSASHLEVATGTFVNRNHLAGYLEITTAVGIGLVLAGLGSVSLPHWRARLRYLIDLLLSPTIRLRVFLVIMVIALVLTRSRTGNVGFFAALAAAGLIYVLLRERRLLLKSLFVFATLFLIDLWIVGTWFGLEEVAQRLEATDAATETRVTVWPALMAALGQYWIAGAGLGTFATAFLPFRPEAVGGFYAHAHNDYAQFLIETGVPGAALLAAMAILVGIHALRLLRNRSDRLVGGIAFGCLMAMIAIGIHGFTDFNLQIPANAATLIAVMGLAIACSPRSRRRRRSEAPGTTGPAASPALAESE